MFKILSLVIFLFIYVTASAQSGEADSLAVVDMPADAPGLTNFSSGDTIVYIRDVNISSQRIDSIKRNGTYPWIENIDSLLRAEQKKNKSGRKLSNKSNSFLDAIFSSSFLKYFLWSIAALLVGFILYRLFLSKGIFARSSAESISDADTEQEINVTDKDYDRLLRNAYAAEDLRSATRFLFLKTLQRLHTRELIIFAADKTNSMYTNEMPPAKRNEFASLALYYEYIWYGNAKINKETFDRVEIKFNEFINKI